MPVDVTFAGIGAVRLGMPRSQLTALGYSAQDGDYYGCVFYSAGDRPAVTYDPTADRVVGIRAPEGRGATSTGIGPGSLLSEVRDAYADRTVEDHLDGSFGQGTSGLLVGDGSGGWISFLSEDGRSVAAVSVSDHDHMGIVEAGCG